MNKNIKKYVYVGIVLISVFVLLNLFIDFQFLTKYDLHISLNPLHQVLNIKTNDTVDLNFDVTNNNFKFCKSLCSYTLYDPYLNRSLINNSEILNSGSDVNKKYQIKLNTRGKGERIFYFKVECNNIRSYLCKTNEKKTTKTSMITINYDMTDVEKNKTKELKAKLNNYSELISQTLDLFELIKNKVDEINKVKTFNYKLNKTIINENIKKLKEIHKLWINEKYSEINFKDSKIKEYYNSLIEIKLDKNIELYNQIANELNEINKSKLSSLDNYYDLNLINEFNNIIQEFNDSEFTRINLIIPKINKFIKNIDELNKNINITENITKHEKIQERYFGKKIKKSKDCEKIKTLINNYIKINNNTVILFENNSEYDLIRNKVIESFIDGYEIDRNNTSFIINGVEYKNTLNLTKKDYINSVRFNYTELMKINKLCNYTLINYSEIKLINTNISKTKNEVIKFQDNSKKCCIFGKCEICNLNKTIPVIFIHGHAFNLNDSIDNNIESFGDLQNKLEQIEYINGGEIGINTKADNTLWSEMNYPLSIKASYYYIIYYDLEISTETIRKTESIDTYALRMKELVDIVKKKTGADKVDIISHSMGGLVSRKYIQLFGGEDVNKLIMIAPPNKGVSSITKQLCPKFGASFECEDMSKGSPFLENLNTFKPDVDTYVIYGTGCNTDGETGDGIVSVTSAKLDYAENIPIYGRCNDLLGFELHNDLLNTKKYPGVYNNIIRILKK